MASVSFQARLRRVRLLLCDVDGVMTDGSVFMGRGGEFKQYNVPDGLGLVLVRKSGIKVGWISARPSTATRVRAKDLGIDFLMQPTDGKVPAAEKMMHRLDLNWDQVCFVGDDVLDLGILRRVGVAIAPANAVPEVRRVAHHVTRRQGGHGAVREVCELILKAQRKWNGLLKQYAN